MLGILAVERNKHFLAKVLAYSHTKDKNYRKILKDHMIKSNTMVWSKYYLESLLFDCKKDIKDLSIQTLLMYGSKSDHINTYLKFYQNNLPNSDIYVVQGESHQLPTRQPSYIYQMLAGFILNKT
ncbi:hypothetical protein [Litchfieldia alkalitelluris]|uniref:hypothetical protein n=1 Tax=Litchfieldia alkalitelluris TaxID=304268 RepID=UPI0009981256|nr:hypothetical protein [Litchfieldia alkalitelluris]